MSQQPVLLGADLDNRARVLPTSERRFLAWQQAGLGVVATITGILYGMTIRLIPGLH